MKYYKIFWHLSFVIILNSFSAAAQDGKVIMKGHAEITESFILLSKSNFSGLNSNPDTIRINNKGDFSFQLFLSEPGNIFLNYGKQQLKLWMEPNTNLTLNLKDSGSVIEGPMSTYAYYYLAKQKETQRLFEEYEQKHPGYNEKESLYTDKYFIINDTITRKKILFLNKYFGGKKVQGKKQFIENEINSILYSNLYYKVIASKTAYKKFAFFQQNFKITGNSTFAFSNLITLNNRKLLKLWEYQSFLFYAIPPIAGFLIKEQGKAFNFDLWIDTQMAVIDQLSADPFCNLHNEAILINRFVSQMKSTKSLQWADKLYSIIKQIQPKDKNHVLQSIKQKLDALVNETKFLKGAPAPPFTFTDTGGQRFKLEDFKGKKVYIDIWATWCGPCLALEPAWNTLVNSYSTNDSVVFLSVSLDDSRETWLKFLKTHHPAGVLLHAGSGGWNNSFAINYDIKGIPHFILLDENGKILAYTAPRPDEPDELKALVHPN